jgi:Xaa-Pro aminopeptidase
MEGLKPSTGIDRGSLADEVAARRGTIAAAMAAAGLEAIAIASEANAFYLTGYETTFFGNKSKPFVVVFAPPRRPLIVCHAGEQPSVELDAIDVDVRPYVDPNVLDVPGGVQIEYQLPAAEATAALLNELGVGSVGLELSWHFMPGFTPLAMDRLRERFHGETGDASPLLWSARRRKSEWEVAQMRIAAAVAEAAHQAFAEEARLGMTEREMNRLLRTHAYAAGAEKIGYTGIVAGIDRAPLGGPTDRRWERGQMLFVDVCLQLNGGYFADFNRVYASAAPTGEQEAAYASVVDALARGREALSAGTTVAELASTMIGGADTVYARVGHGLGLEMPEPPSLSPQDPAALRSGEVLCIEPNTEVPGVGWLVSEEEIVVTDEGFDLLSPSFPTELRVIGS